MTDDVPEDPQGTEAAGDPSSKPAPTPISDIADSASFDRQGPIEAPAGMIAQAGTDELVRAALEGYWRAAHRGDDWDEAGFGDFRDVMGALSDSVLLEELPGAGGGITTGPGVEALEGDVDIVNLRVAARVERLSGDREIAEFGRTTLADAIGRLEREGEATPEQVCDLVVRVLAPLVGRIEASGLARWAYRYLQNQPPADRGTGYYITVGNLAQVLARQPVEHRLESDVLHHMAVRGVWLVLNGPEIDRLEGPPAVLVWAQAHNCAATIARDAQDRAADMTAATAVVQPLATITVATAPRLVLAEGADDAALDSVATHLFGTAELPADATELLTVVAEMGRMPLAWGPRSRSLSRLEAASGTALILAADASQVAPRFFNAGISLQRSEEPADMVGRVVLNSLGLRAALSRATDFVSAFTAFRGLDCAVNLLGSLVDLESSRSDQPWPELRPMAEQVANLARLPQLDPRQYEPDLARLAGSGRRLMVAVGQPPTAESLLASIEKALDVLVPSMDQAPAGLARDTAFRVWHLFRKVLGVGEPLSEAVLPLLEARGNVARTVLDNYRPFAEPTEDPVGRGPFVPAGVCDEAEWGTVARSLLGPIPSSIVPYLRQLFV